MNEMILEEKQKMDQNQDEFMTFKNEKFPNEQNNNNQMINNQNENELRDDLNLDNKKNDETNLNNEEREKNNFISENELKRNVNKNFVKNENYNNYVVKEINHSSPNYYNNNINYNEYDEKNDEIKNSNIHEIIVGNRRIERFDGAECNNNMNKDKQKQNINNQFINNEQDILQNIVPDYNNLDAFNNFNKQVRNNDIYYNDINQINQNLQQNENLYMFNQNDSNNNNYILCNQDKENNFYNNCYNFSNVVNPEGTIKEKNNYKLYSSNNCKTEKNTYISKNYKGSDKTSFVKEKNENENENNCQNNNLAIEKTEIQKEKKQNAPNHKVFVSTYTKTINVKNQIPNQNQNETQNPTILIQTDFETNKTIIPQQYVEQPQIIIQEQKLQNENKNSNININTNINPSKNNNQNGKQVNNNMNVLYPKEGYGNDENIQKKLKKKKKKKIIYIRHKPIALQHFDVQIIQNPVIPQPYQPYQLPPDVPQNNYVVNNHPRYQIHENIVPPVQNRHQNQYVYNSSQLVKIYPSQEEPMCNYNYHRPYTPIIRNNRAMQMRSYMNEEGNNYNYKSPYRPKQTVISLTPMRTINQPNSPFIENMQIPNENEMRYNRREIRNREYRALTPPSYSNNFERQYEYENYNYFNNNYDNRRRRMNDYPLYPNNYYIESRREIFDDNQEEDNIEDSCPCCIYERKGRIMKNMN